jgi:hypothetical protein
MRGARIKRAVVVIALVACSQGVDPAALSPTERITVLRYLECIDCVIPLDSVKALASRKPDATVDTLNRGLLTGPDSQEVAAVERALIAGYIRDSTWRVANGRGLLPLRHLYVQQARDRFVNGYRSRGAMGMGWIRTPRAVAHLDSALTLPLSPSVLWAVRYARDSLPPP